ncbi:Pentatricopeptide repeat (PPR) family protein 1 [Zostera marina]|uniref:Pentatricopeptide repeat (PPR) family protein 1 n=1 Tax=Zostera marina TaxID=29655 RepID=A0A0K9PRR9_ZOSMR|nr:Pentatricopeptide repeat (PPR) family protein 1 [Zostera marina]
MSHRRRPHDTSVSPDSAKRSRLRRSTSSSLPKRSTFPSYLDVPNISPKIRLFCDLLANTPASSVEFVLQDSSLRVSSSRDVEEVLKLSYAFPNTATKFFRWSGAQIRDQHSPYAWNLIVDILGKNKLFEAMWDAVKTMRHQKILSMVTFASIFSSFTEAELFDESFKAFEVMEDYGVSRNVTALNSLLSAVCRVGKTQRGCEFLGIARKTIRPDADSYAILLEGWENEGDAKNAVETFAEMVGVVGWDPSNVPAYDSFLTTLIKAGGISEAMKHLGLIRDKGCLPGMKFFRAALNEYDKEKDYRGGTVIWEMMAWKNKACEPDLSMYNKMIRLLCYRDHLNTAYKLMDEMILYGLFPDRETYNLMLKSSIKGKKMVDVALLFNEMLKNDHLPLPENCRDSLKLFLESDDMKMALKVWKCMVNNQMQPLEMDGNDLVLKLRDLDMLAEACKYAEQMAEKGIKLRSSTLSKLKTSLCKIGREPMYRQLLQKWKLR